MQIKKSYLPILNIFRKNIFLAKTIRKLSIIVKKDYPTIYNAVKELAKKKIIKIKTIGKSKVCELSFSPEAISTLSYLDEQEALSKKIPNLEKIIEFKEFLDDIIIITGSYSKGKETSKSDIDLVIITKDKAFNKQKLIENLTSLMLPKVHPIVITQKDFVNMLLDKKPNFGKEIFNSRYLYRNATRYYLLIKEAIENGFRG